MSRFFCGIASAMLFAMMTDLVQADEHGVADQTSGQAAPQCKVAVVSPISGNAECVDPPGAPVDPPPPRPAQPCPQHLHGMTPEELGCTPQPAAGPPK